MKYIITGGPHSGKTETLQELAKYHYKIIKEAARPILKEEMAKGSDVLPWKDFIAFQNAVSKRQCLNEEHRYGGKATFLDRSLIDLYGYSLEKGVEYNPTSLIQKAGYARVFFLDIIEPYTKDSERIEDRDRAYAIQEALHSAYSQLHWCK